MPCNALQTGAVNSMNEIAAPVAGYDQILPDVQVSTS